MQNINFSIPDDIIYEFKSMPQRGATMDDKLRFTLAVGMFVSRDISLSKAAELAGKNLHDFTSLLKSLIIPAFIYTDEMLEDDLKFTGA